MKKSILLTGASGGVATLLRPLLRARYERVILSDLAHITDLEAGEQLHPADLTDSEAIKAAVQGVDAVLHLGGQSVESDFDSVLNVNIIGTYHLFEACRHQGVERVVFASSNHVVGMYARERRIDSDKRVRPDSRYGWSKAAGEAMASLYADKHGIRVMSIRIGNVASAPADRRRLAIWIHPEDLLQLCAIGIEHADVHHAIVYGASDNQRGWWDNREAFALGYRPAHRAEDFADSVLAKSEAPNPLSDVLQGGTFCEAEFDGDLDRTRYS